MTSYTPPHTHTRRAFRGLFIWQISLWGVSTFITPMLSLSLSSFSLDLYPTIYSSAIAYTGVSYRWPINAGVEARYIHVYLQAWWDRFRERPRATRLRNFSAPLSSRFSRSDGVYLLTASRGYAKTLYYVNRIKCGASTSNDYQLTLIWFFMQNVGKLYCTRAYVQEERKTRNVTLMIKLLFVYIF